MKHKSIEEIFEDCEVLVPYRSALKPKISVIVRIHGVRQYLEQCLDSVLSQSLKEIEIILANDCSPDPLEDEMCMKYAQKDERVVYLRAKRNLRLWGITMCGLKVAQAPYVGMVDGDDWIEERMYEVMLDKLLKNHVDVVQVGMSTHHENGAVYHHDFNDFKEQIVILDDDFYSIDFFEKYKLHNGMPCKLFKKSIFEHKGFIHPVGLFSEDVITMVFTFHYSKKIMVLNDCYYNYRFRGDSLSRVSLGKWYKFGLDNLGNFNIIKEFLIEKNLYEKRVIFYRSLVNSIMLEFVSLISTMPNFSDREKRLSITNLLHPVISGLDVKDISLDMMKQAYSNLYSQTYRFINFQTRIIKTLKKVGLFGIYRLLKKIVK